jgi:hypothetical protein
MLRIYSNFRKNALYHILRCLHYEMQSILTGCLISSIYLFKARVNNWQNYWSYRCSDNKTGSSPLQSSDWLIVLDYFSFRERMQLFEYVMIKFGIKWRPESIGRGMASVDDRKIST